MKRWIRKGKMENLNGGLNKERENEKLEWKKG